MRDQHTEKFLSLQEVAEHVGCSLSTARRWATQGVDGRVLQTVRCGRLVRTTLSHLHSFMAANQAVTMPQPDAELERVNKLWEQSHV